jgi:hypothetical protein
MIIDLVFEAYIPGGISARLPLENDGTSIRHDQPGPDEQDTGLAESNLAIVDPDQTRSLRLRSTSSLRQQ